jgi:hypothetical protein
VFVQVVPIQKRNERVPINGVILKAQAVHFTKLLGGDETFKVSDEWLWRWKDRHGICQINIKGESASGDSAAAEQFPETLRKAISDGGYTNEQLYNCDEAALYYKLLPNKSLDLKKAPTKAGMKTNKERVTLLLCANKTGDHKLKPLCIGKSLSPDVSST